MELTGIDTLRYTNPFPEQIPEEGTYKVYNNEQNLDIKTLLTAPAHPVFVFPKYLWDEVQYLTKQSPNSEFAMFLVTKQFSMTGPKYMALDMFFPKQEAGHSGVSIANEDCEGFYKLLSTHEQYKDHLHSKIAHLHSHNTMGVFWSGADNNQQLSRDDLGFWDDFRYYLVVNTHDQVRCSFVVYKPLLRRVDNIPVAIIGTEDTLTDERKAELDAYLKERLTPLVTNVFADIKTFDGFETELPPPVYTKPKTFAPVQKFNWPAYDDISERSSYWQYGYGTADEDEYVEAARKLINYCKRNYSGEEYAPDEIRQLRMELFKYDVDGVLLDLLDFDADIVAVADVFNGDIAAAVDACIWLAEHDETKHIYRDLLNEEV